MRAVIVQDREQEQQGTLSPTLSRSAGQGASRAERRNHRAEWVRKRALDELLDLQQRGADVAGALARYERGETGLVDVYWSYTKGKPGRQVWPDAPDGLRRRDIVAGLQRAAMDWTGTCAR